MADVFTRLGDLANWLKTDLGQAALAGAAGGAIRWITLRERPRDGFVSLLVGSICAIYAGPLVEPFLSPFVGKITPGDDADGFAAFVVGIGGISLAGAVIDLFRGFSSRAKTPGHQRPGHQRTGNYAPTHDQPYPQDPNAPAALDEDFPARPPADVGGAK